MSLWPEVRDYPFRVFYCCKRQRISYGVTQYSQLGRLVAIQYYCDDHVPEHIKQEADARKSKDSRDRTVQ